VKNVAVVDGVTRITLNEVCAEVGPGAAGANAEVVPVEEAGRVGVVCTVYVTILTGGGFAEDDGGAAALNEILIEEDVGAAGLCESVV
jgi:hypothetical protein